MFSNLAMFPVRAFFRFFKDQARNKDFSRGVQRSAPKANFFFLSNARFVFTVAYGFLYYIDNVRYKD